MEMKIHATICVYIVNIFRDEDTCSDSYLYAQYFQGDLMEMKIHAMICICMVNIFRVI